LNFLVARGRGSSRVCGNLAEGRSLVPCVVGPHWLYGLCFSFRGCEKAQANCTGPHAVGWFSAYNGLIGLALNVATAWFLSAFLASDAADEQPSAA